MSCAITTGGPRLHCVALSSAQVGGCCRRRMAGPPLLLGLGRDHVAQRRLNTFVVERSKLGRGVEGAQPAPPLSWRWRWRRLFGGNHLSCNSLRTAKSHRQLAVEMAFWTEPLTLQELADRQIPPPIRRWRWRFGRNHLSCKSLRTAKSHRQFAVDFNPPTGKTSNLVSRFL